MSRISLLTIVLVFVGFGCGGSKPPIVAGGKTTEQWIESLGDKDVAVRILAVQKLGNIGSKNPQVVPAMLEALSDDDPAVRKEAIYAVVRTWPLSRQGLPRLAEMKDNDKDLKIRKMADEAHGNLAKK